MPETPDINHASITGRIRNAIQRAVKAGDLPSQGTNPELHSTWKTVVETGDPPTYYRMRGTAGGGTGWVVEITPEEFREEMRNAQQDA